MNFKQAYQEMLKGKKIKRPGWGSYWFIEDGKVKIKLKTGKIIENDFNQETITNTLADDWEVINEEKKKMWEPKIKEDYYFISGTGHISCNPYDDDGIDKRFLSLGNCFQTEKQAEFMAEKLRVIHELEKFAYENNEEEIDWNNENQEKYAIVFNHLTKDFTISLWRVSHNNPLNIYFSSEEIAKKAIETIGEDSIKKYYFGVEEDE